MMFRGFYNAAILFSYLEAAFASDCVIYPVCGENIAKSPTN